MQVNNNAYSYATEIYQNSSKNVATSGNASSKNEGTVSSPTQLEPEYATYTKESLVEDAAKDQTTFPRFNIFSKMEKYVKVLNEHYSKVNEENKKFPNPEQHINDKYFNKKSPYYIKGLTQRERKICADAEYDVLMGKAPNLNSDDPVIMENFGGCNVFMEEMEWNQEIRDTMNDAIRQAFKENGIVIPEDADLKLTIDPYDFFIHASGVDESLAKRIEAALNQGSNGYSLYQHISFCNPVNYGVEEPYQYIQGNKEKMTVYHFVNRLTGYDIRELENKGGKFYTPDGEDLWGVLRDSYNKLVEEGKADASTLGRYEAAYQRVAKAGWNRTTDCNLTIGYKDGFLYDIGTSHGYGPGQTAWQDRLKSWWKGIQEDYLREREEALKREENTPTELEMAERATAEHMERLFGKESTSASQTAEPLTPSLAKLSAIQALLERLQKDGMLGIAHLTNKVLNLRGEERTIQGFDCKA